MLPFVSMTRRMRQSLRRRAACFKAAAPRLGISPRLVHAVDYLFCHTRPQDWQPDSRPIVWPSNETLPAAASRRR